jgi:hypothetical protein
VLSDQGSMLWSQFSAKKIGVFPKTNATIEFAVVCAKKCQMFFAKVFFAKLLLLKS